MLTDAQRLALVHLVEVWSPISDRRSKLTASYLRQIHGSIRSILSGERSARASVLPKAGTRFAKWAADQDAESFAWAIPLTDDEAQALRAALETAGVLTVYEETYRAESLVLERRSRLAKQGLIPTFPRPSTSMALAPFLSSDGETMLLALGACSSGEGLSLHLLTAVTGTKGWGYRRDDDGHTNRGNISSADILGAVCEHYNPLITEGIYFAPWQPYGQSDGGALVVVDRDSRLVAILDYANADTDVTGARQDAQALLDMARARYQPSDSLPTAPSGGYHDPYNDDNKLDMDDCGEDWKR